MKSNRPNMHDVAKLAGVSIATISHTINGTRAVSSDTRARVTQAINQLGYTPDLFARGMRIGKKNIIGFIVPDISNKYFASIIEKVEEIISESGYYLIIFNTKETENNEIQRIKYLTSGSVDGLLLASTIDDYSKIQGMIPPNFPLVLVDRKLRGNYFDSVTINSYDAIYQGIVNMIRDGHTRIGYIAGLERLNTTTERLSAYKQALSDFHIPLNMNYVQYGNSMAGSAYSCARELYFNQNCSAIVVSNGLMSIDVIDFMIHNGIRIGETVDLLCFNDFNNIVFTSLFPISMVNQPFEELGIYAGKQILERIKNPGAPIKDITLNCTYSVKQSLPVVSGSK